MTAIGDEAFEVLRLMFSYDEAIPLDVKVVERLDAPEYVREKLVFRGVRDSRVPAYLAVPKRGAAPHPCVVLLHGIGGSKEGWWKGGDPESGVPLVQRLLTSGYSVLTVDCEYHGERLADNDYESPAIFMFEYGWHHRTRDMVVQSVVEHRRAIDVLSRRSDVDVSRLGIVGYSMGGMMAFMLTAIEARITAAVACVTPIVSEPHSAIAVHNHAPRITSQPFLMLMAADDGFNYTTESARVLHELIASPTKEIVFFDGGHDLPDEWRQRTMVWLDMHVKPSDGG